jgi:16S rRNA (adenine1518-N6/adenine1519-N6)-dimethyltransferase
MRSQHTFKKQFGQNFLRGMRFAHEMVDILQLTPQDIIVEIGPGDGMVTKLLLESQAAMVIAIEVDYQLIPNLIKKFGESSKFELVNSDVLQVDFSSLSKDFSNPANIEMWQTGKYNLKLVGSLPYNISKVIIRKALTEWPAIQNMAFIVQEEVAQDYVAKPPKGSWLSNWIRIFADIKKHHSIPASQFYPQPKVGGGILEITPHKTPLPERETLAKLVRAGFLAPRKTLQNNWKSQGITLPDELKTKRASEVDMVELAQAVLQNPAIYRNEAIH